MRRGWAHRRLLSISIYKQSHLFEHNMCGQRPVRQWLLRLQPDALLSILRRGHLGPHRQIPSDRQQQREGRVLPTLATGPIRAVLLDVDGTLYYQQRLRSFMACELCVLPVVQMSCSSAYDIWRALSMFRRVREGLRHVGKRTCVLPSGSISQQRSGRDGNRQCWKVWWQNGSTNAH